MKRITDTDRINWLSDCTVLEGNKAFASAFARSQEGVKKAKSLREAIDAAIREGEKR